MRAMPRGADPSAFLRSVQAAALLLAVFTAGSLGAQDLILRHEFLCERETRPGIGEPPVLSDQEMGRRLMEEAEWVYLGMIYGFNVEYVPLDLGRRVSERFSVEPAWDSAAERSGLSFGEYRFEGTRLLAYVEYRANPVEAARYEAWRRNTGTPYQAEGTAPETDGLEGRFKAMRAAIKEAVREYARALEPNKPRLVRARAAFESPPSVFVRSGLYVAHARVRISMQEIRPYPSPM